MNTKSKVLLGILGAAAAGVVIGLLVAPDKGNETRKTSDRDVQCILGSFVRASGNPGRFSDWKWSRERPLGMRGHFGDLQFLHAMAPEKQPADKTYGHVRMWMEFAWLASLGRLDLRSDACTVPVKGMCTFFVKGSRKVGDLLNYRFGPSAQGVALGQMLHIAQDSFAACHVQRNAAGQVVRYLSYDAQSRKRHAEKDAVYPETGSANGMDPLAFGIALLEARAARKEWNEIEPLIRQYFEPVPGAAKAGAGHGCGSP